MTEIGMVREDELKGKREKKQRGMWNGKVGEAKLIRTFGYPSSQSELNIYVNRNKCNKRIKKRRMQRDEKIVTTKAKKVGITISADVFVPRVIVDDICSTKREIKEREIRERQARRSVIIMKMERRKQVLTSRNENARIRNKIIKME